MSSDKAIDDLEKNLEDVSIRDDVKNDPAPAEASDLPEIDPETGKHRDELMKIGQEYSLNLCDMAITDMLNYHVGKDVFSGLRGCGNVSAKTNDGEEWTFNYEVKNKGYAHEIPEGLRADNGGPNDQVTNALGQLIKMYCIHYEKKMTEFVRTHPEDESKSVLGGFRKRPYLDQLANLWLVEDIQNSDKCLGLVFRKKEQ